MKTSDFSFLSSDGVTKLHARSVLPEDDSDLKGVIQLVIPMEEETGRYDETAAYFAGRGFAVYSHDHIGSGASLMEGGEEGVVPDTEQPEQVLIEDIRRLRFVAEERHPGLPFYMVGIGTGTFFLRAMLSTHGDGITGVILQGTGYWNDWKCLFRRMKVKRMVKRYGPRGRGILYEDLTGGRAVYAKYPSAPPRPFFTWNAYLALVNAVMYSCSETHIGELPKNLQVHLSSGTEDVTGNYGAGVRRLQEKMLTSGMSGITCKLFPGMGRCPEDEKERDTVLILFLTFLRKTAIMECRSSYESNTAYAQKKEAERKDYEIEQILL